MPAAWASDTLTVSGDMAINEDITVSDVVFTSGGTLSGTGTITIDSTAGITVETGTATISNNVVFAAGTSAVQCTVNDDGILVQTGVWSGTSPIKLVGQGYAKRNNAHAFHLRGANTFTGRLTLSKARVYAYGDGAFGASSGRVEWVQGGTNGSILFFGGGEWSDLFFLSGWAISNWYTTPRTLAGTTNVFNNSFSLHADADQYPQFGANSYTVFAGAVTGGKNYKATLNAGSAVVVTNSNITTACFRPSGSGTFYLHGALVRSGNSGPEYFPSCRVVCLAENRFNGLGTRGGFVAAGGMIDLNGFDQHGGALRSGDATGTFTSESSATWFANQGVASTNANVFAGAVNLEKSGAMRLGLKSASTSTGKLVIAEGEVEFTDTGSWAGDMEVNAGSLIFNALRTLGTTQTLRIAEGAKVVLNGGYLNAQNVYYDGRKLAVGEYSAAKGDAFVGGDYILNVIAAPVVGETATWTGEGADAAIGTAAICAGGELAAKTLTVDANGGAEFTSIDAAVAVAEPGDTVRVMPGLYRETVVVRRGGKNDRPIVIESAVRGGAVVRGSEVWKNDWTPLDGHPGVLSSPIDESWFTNGVVNPYATTIAIGSGGVGRSARCATNDVADVEKYLPRTLGQIFIEGRPVTEVTSIRALDESPNTWMVSPRGGEIWLHPSVTDIPLDGRLVEWSVRDRLLHAARRGLAHVVVRGFIFEHCANQGPFPQRGAVDVRSGNHWIVEHNIIRFAKTIGLAVGSETWDGKKITDVPESDRRVMQSVNVHVRYNTVSDNGMCGIAAWNPVNLRIYNNVVERNNAGCYWWRNRYWDETAGIKVHCGNTVVANNLIRDNEAHGIWFDTGFVRVRITGNAILNNRRSGIMFETAFGSALVDCNVIAYTRQDGDTYYAGDGIYSHNGSGVTVAHNLLAGNAGMGVRFRTTYGKIDVWTAGKHVKRDVETSGNRYLNNIFYDNAAGELMVSATNRLSNGTVSEGNLYLKDGRRSVRYPFRFADYNIDIKGGFSNVWERVSAVDPANALPFAAWTALERPATLAEWRTVQGLDTTSQAMSGAYIDTITRDLLLVLRLPKELKEFRGKSVAGIDMDFRGKPYPGPDADVRPGPFVGFDWDDRGVQFALDPFERTTPPAIPVR